MRIRFLIAFIVGFAVTGIVSLNILQKDMGQSFDRIERRDLVAHAGRVVQSIETGLDHLQGVTRDYATWTEMYAYVTKPDPAWVKENTGLKEADLSLMLIYGAQGELVFMISRNKPDGSQDNSLLPADPYLAVLKKSSQPVRFKRRVCGNFGDWALVGHTSYVQAGRTNQITTASARRSWRAGGSVTLEDRITCGLN